MKAISIFYSAAFLAFLFSGCTASSIRRPASEGFFDLDARPAASQGFNLVTIQKSARSVGSLYVAKEFLFSAGEIAETRSQRCGTEDQRKRWLVSCGNILASRCDNGCHTDLEYQVCTVANIEEEFVTARHCFDEVRVAYGVFVGADGKGIRVDFRMGKRMQHHQPYDLAVLDVLSSRTAALIPSLKIAAPLSKGENVYSLGFADLPDHLRTEKNAEYDYPDGTALRVTYGHIVDVNLQKKSFCTYTNLISNADPADWTLEASCAPRDFQDFMSDLRVETNVVLADTDMTFGMSGAPLFNYTGQVIGVGSTLKAREIGNYQSGIPAIYSKSENLSSLRGIN